MRRTSSLLSGDKRTLLQLHEESGIPFYWLKKFSANEMANPSVNRVQELYEFLSRRKLAVA